METVCATSDSSEQYPICVVDPYDASVAARMAPTLEELEVSFIHRLARQKTETTAARMWMCRCTPIALRSTIIRDESLCKRLIPTNLDSAFAAVISSGLLDCLSSLSKSCAVNQSNDRRYEESTECSAALCAVMTCGGVSRIGFSKSTLNGNKRWMQRADCGAWNGPDCPIDFVQPRSPWLIYSSTGTTPTWVGTIDNSLSQRIDEATFGGTDLPKELSATATSLATNYQTQMPVKPVEIPVTEPSTRRKRHRSEDSDEDESNEKAPSLGDDFYSVHTHATRFPMHRIKMSALIHVRDPAEVALFLAEFCASIVRGYFAPDECPACGQNICSTETTLGDIHPKCVAAISKASARCEETGTIQTRVVAKTSKRALDWSFKSGELNALDALKYHVQSIEREAMLVVRDRLTTDSAHVRGVSLVEDFWLVLQAMRFSLVADTRRVCATDLSQPVLDNMHILNNAGFSSTGVLARTAMLSVDALRNSAATNPSSTCQWLALAGLTPTSVAQRDTDISVVNANVWPEFTLRGRSPTKYATILCGKTARVLSIIDEIDMANVSKRMYAIKPVSRRLETLDDAYVVIFSANEHQLNAVNDCPKTSTLQILVEIVDFPQISCNICQHTVRNTLHEISIRIPSNVKHWREMLALQDALLHASGARTIPSVTKQFSDLEDNEDPLALLAPERRAILAITDWSLDTVLQRACIRVDVDLPASFGGEMDHCQSDVSDDALGPCHRVNGSIRRNKALNRIIYTDIVPPLNATEIAVYREMWDVRVIPSESDTCDGSAVSIPDALVVTRDWLVARGFSFRNNLPEEPLPEKQQTLVFYMRSDRSARTSLVYNGPEYYILKSANEGDMETLIKTSFGLAGDPVIKMILHDSDNYRVAPDATGLMQVTVSKKMLDLLNGVVCLREPSVIYVSAHDNSLILSGQTYNLRDAIKLVDQSAHFEVDDRHGRCWVVNSFGDNVQKFVGRFKATCAAIPGKYVIVRTN